MVQLLNTHNYTSVKDGLADTNVLNKQLRFSIREQDKSKRLLASLVYEVSQLGKLETKVSRKTGPLR